MCEVKIVHARETMTEGNVMDVSSWSAKALAQRGKSVSCEQRVHVEGLSGMSAWGMHAIIKTDIKTNKYTKRSIIIMR